MLEVIDFKVRRKENIVINKSVPFLLEYPSDINGSLNYCRMMGTNSNSLLEFEIFKNRLPHFVF